MKTTRQTTLKHSMSTLLVGIVLMVWAADEQAPTQSSFEMCLEELKEATSSSTDEETESDFDPAMSLEESIRIYDECLRREGVTLSIHESLGGESGTSAGTEGSQPSNTGTEEGTQSATEDASATDQSSSPSESSDLEASIQEFDEMLAQMQGKMDADRAQQQAKAASESTQVAMETTTEDQESIEDVNASDTEDSISNPSAMVSAEAKHQENSKSEPLDPKDEDIILKTIREAAEIETDPTTKQALWDQYYDYAGKN